MGSGAGVEFTANSHSNNVHFPFHDRRHTKYVHDNVHGNIHLDPLSLAFIDTEQFQRLRDLKQLGLTYLVYPGAVHSRFEHSLGVYWLSGQALNRLQYFQATDPFIFMFQGPELDIHQSDIMAVKLAGLLHDVGHGPFSHLFDRAFLPVVLKGSEWFSRILTSQFVRSHEQMSAEMIDFMVDEHNIDIDPNLQRRVKEMILASCNTMVTNGLKEKQYLYDIVANGRNGIDVDKSVEKFDYIARDCRACGIGCNFQYERLMDSMRVIGDEICYRAKEYRIEMIWTDLTIQRLFSTRADLFRTVYTHAKVKALELMFVDALLLADKHLGISSSIHNPADYWKLDDTIMKRIETDPDEELRPSRELILRMRRRDLYQFCNEYAVPKDQLEHFKDVTAHDIVCSQKKAGVNLREEDIAISNIRIDLTRGKDNPLEW
ncbi:Deoxynucleoside triphosphate triphosphohydrolase SAMHD1-like protein [Nymphaea thermarum]|nr:Deoxynucleoside triphosphate triphosphohydrolase SAMHD1-like protein [Nymphaea thermarum]